MRFKEFLKEAIAPPATTAAPAAPIAAPKPGAFTVDVPKGNRGVEVADMQKALIALGYPLPKFGVDGIRGRETSAAVRKFQQDNQLKADGVPSTDTIAKLNSILAAQPEISSKLKKSTPAEVKAKGPVQLPPMAQDAVTKGKVGEILNLIARYESRGNYNIIAGGKIVPELTNMTLAELINFQNELIRTKSSPSSAAGRYQYIRDSLKMVADQMKLDYNTTKFDPATQDAIAIYDLRRRANLDQWLEGKLSDEQFLNKVAAIWAGIPTTGGVSAYQNVGNNKAGTTTQNAIAALQNIKSGPATATA